LLKSEQSGAITVILRGSSLQVVEEAKRAFNDAVCILRTLIADPSVVLGAGVAESVISTRFLQNLLSEETEQRPGRERERRGGSQHMEMVVRRAFAEALESIPITLASNSGMDASTALAELRSLNSRSLTTQEGEARRFSYGVDIMTRKVRDMSDSGVYETLAGKLAQLSMGTQVATSLLKVDDVFPAW
jgi:T-complex protein 1 subunit epsilon